MTSRTPFFGHRRQICAVLVALSLFPITACTGGGATPGATAAPPSSSPTGSLTPTPTPTPTASYKPADASGRAQNVPVPALPETAKAETKEGLEAFARYWFDQLNFAYETGDTSGLDSVTSPSCQFCSNIVRSLTTNYADDRWLAGGRIETPSISTTFERGSDGQYQVVVQVQQAMITYFEPGGVEFRESTQPSDTGNVLLVKYASDSWQLAALHPIR
ncbi:MULTISPECIES: DUF6318 family protein [unclassified Arthrobacter]|uniref:DUF6318 family protein n=1 Tax=unclassified Arthrobacter TaxID=235627 RepID=UPI002DFA3404|nr:MULTISPECIES: DUF6318 family protein [unclassified Arthrobacter]MEC5191814.1 hypothetical protein [Arthrobacter sp. MP_M4]MEC5203504.1 hypothetical protein [Arthrobacter sp. MP_M7]